MVRSARWRLASGDELVGAPGPQLLLDGRPVEGFAAVDRDGWHAPGGGDASVFAIAETGGGGWLVAVHVGGLWRSGDRGRTWLQVVPTDADVHHVIAVDGTRAAVAAAAGVATSGDDGRTFAAFRTDGLAHRYCTAVAAVGDTLVVGSSNGPFGETVLYRGAWAGGPFERTGVDLPTVEPVLSRFALEGGTGFRYTVGETTWSSPDGRTWRPS